jgi:hypothetical protein
MGIMKTVSQFSGLVARYSRLVLWNFDFTKYFQDFFENSLDYVRFEGLLQQFVGQFPFVKSTLALFAFSVKITTAQKAYTQS